MLGSASIFTQMCPGVTQAEAEARTPSCTLSFGGEVGVSWQGSEAEEVEKGSKQRELIVT
jgi:hypothetical protein